MGYDALGPGLAGATKETVMSYPIDALKSARADQLRPGAFFFDGHGQWFLSAQRADRQTVGAIRLTRRGEALLGSYIPDPHGEAFAVSEPYTVQIAVDDYSEMVTDGQFLGSILAGSPNTIFAAENDRALFSLDGLEQGDGAPTSRRWRFLRWSGWLVDEHGRRVGNQPLFTVDANDNVDA
jgi:hypothetical protein